MSIVSNHSPEVVAEVHAHDDGHPSGRVLVRVRKPLTPVNGSVRVLRPVGTVAPNAGEILINGKPYYFTRHATGYRLTGYDDRKGEVTTYDLPLDLSSCDCPDGTYRGERPGGCKHRRAILAMRRAGKL
jgi:hypothetical protein